MRKVVFITITAAAFAGLLLLSKGLQAQRLQILDDVQITEEDDCAVIRVGFNIPVRYLNHFPLESGDDLRIQLEPITISPGDKGLLFKREYLRPPPNDIAALSEVVYEGHIEGGPFLTLLFLRSVSFKVEQGSDFRSLFITVSGSEESEPCPSVQ